MKSIRFCLNLLAYSVLATCVAQAQASRTWVSGVGDDANPCSRIAPCKTFAGAISKTAAGGEIDALDPAGFGAVTITKAMTIDGGGGQVASVLVSGTNGIIVSAGANDTVTLRNLSINGLASGINGVKFVSGSALHVEHCTIFNFANHGIDLEPSAGGQVFVVGTVSRGNAESGLSAVATVPNVNVTISDSQFERNRFGIFAGDFSRITVRNSEASGNQVGFVSQANAGQSVMNLVNSTATNNTTAGVQVGGAAPHLRRRESRAFPSSVTGPDSWWARTVPSPHSATITTPVTERRTPASHRNKLKEALKIVPPCTCQTGQNAERSRPGRMFFLRLILPWGRSPVVRSFRSE